MDTESTASLIDPGDSIDSTASTINWIENGG
jgi:hypothetical protein